MDEAYMNPYVIGFVASDGHVKKTEWLISQSHISVDVLYKIRRFFGGQLKPQNSDKSYSTKMKYLLIFRKRARYNPFEVWGIPEGKKTYTLRFPENKKDEDIWLYLRGFFDGDGSISVEKKTNKYPRVQIISNMTWCHACKEFMQKFDVKSYVCEDKRHKGIGNVIIRRINSVHKFFYYIYKDPIPLFMDRKYYKWLEMESLSKIIKENKEHKILSELDIENIRVQLNNGIKLKILEKEYGNEIILSKINKEINLKILRKKEELAEKFIKAGKNRKELKKLGISNFIAERVFKRIKREIDYKQGIPFLEETKLKIIEYLKQGLRSSEISNLLNISRNSVNKINRKITGGFKVQNAFQREEKKKLVRELILKGFGRNRICMEFHVSKGIIHKVREDMGLIKPRKIQFEESKGIRD